MVRPPKVFCLGEIQWTGACTERPAECETAFLCVAGVSLCALRGWVRCWLILVSPLLRGESALFSQCSRFCVYRNENQILVRTRIIDKCLNYQKLSRYAGVSGAGARRRNPERERRIRGERECLNYQKSKPSPEACTSGSRATALSPSGLAASASP